LNQDIEMAKAVATAMASSLQSGEEDVVEDGFEKLALIGFRVPATVAEHAFQIPPETWHYALTICAFVGGIFADAGKEAGKKYLSELLTKFFHQHQPLTAIEQSAIVKSVQTQGRALGIPVIHQHALEADLQKLFDKGLPIILSDR
jgi:hypothetical protein